MLSSRGSSTSRDGTCVSCTAGRFFTNESPGKPYMCLYIYLNFFKNTEDIIGNSCLGEGNLGI